MSALKAPCPSCGAELEFRAGSFYIVCRSCGGASWRKDMDLENLGRVAEVAPIDSLLEIGTRGRAGDRPWTAVGQVQLDHGAGPWNEWCLAFDDGTHAWLAEAQGELLYSRAVPPVPVPPHDRLKPGDPVDLGKAGTFVVAEVGKGRVTAVRGELPDRVRPGEPRAYADLRGKEGLFGTLDYGDDRTCDAIYVGRSVTPEDVGLSPAKAPPPAERRAEAGRLQCAKCGGEIRLLDPAGTVRVACRSCNTLLDVSEPQARIVGLAMKVKGIPRIPLGSRGRIRGHDVEVLAFLVRSVKVEGTRYDWDEYLLRTARGSYLWLTEYEGHWNFVEPVNLGNVRVEGDEARHGDTTFRHFQGARATTDGVLGEVYWEAKAGDTVTVADYVAPPLMLSVESDEKERVISLGTYTAPAEVEQAFRLAKPLGEPRGVFANQPNPHRSAMWKWWGLAGAFAAADVAMTAIFAASDRETWTFPCCMTLPVLLLPAVVVSTRSANFEKERWAESDHPSGGGEVSPKSVLVFIAVAAVVLFSMISGC